MEPHNQPTSPGEVPHPEFSEEERMWATFAHLSGLLGCIVPLGNVVAPLVIWLWQKDKSVFVADQAREALNFQITVTLAIMASVLLMYVLIGFLLIFLVGVFAFISIIVAAVRANKGRYYRYPLTFRFVP